MRDVQLKHVNYNVFKCQSEPLKCNEKANLVKKVMRNVQLQHVDYNVF